ncbi:hypothetical protein [Stigmatella erecta]|uniref:Secreted protein n=1 Tax=Stigmatella erecta TaxID=83460 RepID=A0A1I0CVH0_9BACT|nr:hypothetical protein [Stigmatella erecta]SET23563.1 hypothetical protein SAMN05443639_102264 [Stigmatella erecta]
MNTKWKKSPSPAWTALGLGAGLLLTATPSAAAECQEFAGLQHCAVGEASLQPTKGGLAVEIHGEDAGVRIATPGLRSWGAKFEPVALEKGASMRIRGYGRQDDGVIAPVAEVAVASDPAAPEEKIIYLDLSASRSQTFSYRGYLQGQLVCEESGLSAMTTAGRPGKTLPFWLIPVGIYILNHADGHVEYSQKEGWSGGVSWNGKATVKTGKKGEKSCVADLMMFTPDHAEVRATELEATELTGTHLKEFHIVREDLDCTRFSGMDHCALGASVLEHTDEGLTVRSKDGQGAGVRIDTAEASGWDAWLTPLEPKENSRMEMTFRGALPDGAQEVRERMAVAFSPEQGQGALYVDPSVHGASTYTVRGYAQGKLVFEHAHVAPVREQIGEGVPSAQLFSFPGPWGSIHGIAGPGGCTPTLDFPWTKPIRLPDFGETAAVDLVTFEPEGVKFKSSKLGNVSVQAVGMDSFTIQREVLSP